MYCIHKTNDKIKLKRERERTELICSAPLKCEKKKKEYVKAFLRMSPKVGTTTEKMIDLSANCKFTSSKIPKQNRKHMTNSKSTFETIINVSN